MSTILDALSKAEQERQLGALPDLRLPPGVSDASDQSPRRLPAGWLLVPAAGLLAAGIWWWVASTDATEPQTFAVTPTQAERATREQDVNAGPAPAGGPATNPGAGANRTDAPDEPATPAATALAQKPEMSGSEKLPATLRSGVNWTTGKPAAETPKPAPAAKPDAAKAPGGLPGGNAQRDNRAALATAASSGAGRGNDQAAGAAERAVAPLARDLPASVRSQLPELKIGGYIYSATPAERSVLINNRLLREGDSLSADLRLEQLRPDGVVLDYRGQRYRVRY